MGGTTAVEARRSAGRRRGRWWFPLLAVMLVGIAGLVLAELLAVLGFVDYRNVLGTQSDEPWQNPGNRIDRELIHIHEPNRQFIADTAGGDITYYLDLDDTNPQHIDVTTDHHGFRNPTDYEQADVVVLGDSFVEGIAVSAKELVTAQLSGMLGVSVANLGQIWYGPQQELAVFRRFGLALKPKVCVWCFFEGNDLKDFARYSDFQEHWDEKMAEAQPLKHRLLSRNLLLRALGLAGPDRSRPSGEPNAGRTLAGRKIYFSYPCDDFPPEQRQMLPGFQQTLSDWNSECVANGVVPIFAYVPTKFRVYQGICELPADGTCSKWKVGNNPAEIRELVSSVSAEIRFLDLTGPLHDAAEAGDDTYILDDTHWSPTGHRVVARALSSVILPLVSADE